MRNVTLDRVVRSVAIGFSVFVITFLVTHGTAAGTRRSVSGAGMPPARLDTPQPQPAKFLPGPIWTGSPGRGWGQQQIDSFTDYPLAWLGTSFAGYNLGNVDRIKQDPATYPYKAPPPDYVQFIYGDCTVGPNGQGCHLPSVVQIRPLCNKLPSSFVATVKAGPLESVRGGALMQRFYDGHVMVWTGRVNIYISVTAGPALVDQAVQQLRGVGRNAAETPAGQALTAPDFARC